MNSTSIRIAAILTAVGLSACSAKWTETEANGIRTVKNEGGPALGYSAASGVKVLTVDRLGFKDLNRNGALEPYEDWRLTAEQRARDLASRLSVEQIAGLMLYSRHQAIPAIARGPNVGGTYGGKQFPESGASADLLSDQQKAFLTDDNLRHVLITQVESPEIAARWNNNAQALVEGLGMGVPVNISSDPRHGTVATAEYNAGAGGRISMWPSSLGMSATFDPELEKKFAGIAAREYRALGIATALSPQVDLATEPRWGRFSGTFGEHPQLATDMARAYAEGFQTSTGARQIADGWGYDSVNAMVKHWPGGGSGESGRDAHYGYGKYAVYPGNNFETHLKPFVDGAFKLLGGTGAASAVMPYYTISYNQDTKNKENVGNSYSEYIITELLRTKYGYEGVICTDWGVTADGTGVQNFSGRPWGVEGLNVAQRHYKVLMAGVDQFGGNNEKGPVIEAYQIGVKEKGEPAMRARFEQSAVRLLKNIFRTGLFENPYLDVENSKAVVGNPEFMQAGYEAQLKSIVMLKNKDKALPLRKGMTAYVPKRTRTGGAGGPGGPPGGPAGAPPQPRQEYPVAIEQVKKYFNVTDDPARADFALVFIEGPRSGAGYDPQDLRRGGTGYVPISLQYRPYTAKNARATSIAGGDPFEKSADRGYRGKTVTTSNASDLAMVTDTAKKMSGKPVIVVVDLDNPMVMAEFEQSASAILVSFGVQDQALLETLAGGSEPSGLLPLQIPADMETVEAQLEDAPLDMKPYKDSLGNTYDFGFGLNWQGPIKDARGEKYKATG